MFEKKVFISHSSKNKEIAEHLCAFIARLGVKEKDIFCSSVIGQGIANGEKLNNAIANAIRKSTLLIFLISNDFLQSSYCMEELGVGWYLSQQGFSTSYYIILPDVELSDLVGFVNSKIDKISFLDYCHQKDFSSFPRDIYKSLSLKAKEHTSITNAEHVFFSSISVSLDQLQEDKRNRVNELIHDKETIASLTAELDSERLKHSSSLLQSEWLLQYTKIEKEQVIWQTERDTIAKLFSRFGDFYGIDRETFEALPAGFWFEAIHAYIDLDGKVNTHQNDCEMEKFITRAYLFRGNIPEAYSHLKAFVRIQEGCVFLHDIEEFASEYPFTMGEILNHIEDALSFEKEEDIHDSLIEVRDYLRNRELSLVNQ